MLKKYTLFIVLFSFSLKAAEQSCYYFGGHDLSERYILGQNFVEALEEKHANLKKSPFFESENKADHLHKKAEKVYLDNDNKKNTMAFYVSREKDNLVIVVPPLKGRQERMAHIAAVFPESDILFIPCYFSHRSVKNEAYSHWKAGTLDEGFTLSGSYVVLAYEWAKKQKKYKETIATGVCYGSCLVVEAQRQLQECGKSFDRIILDSMPTALGDMSQNYCQDPTGVQSGGSGTSSDMWKWCASWSLAKGTYNFISGNTLPELSFAERLKEVTCPVFFIHGTNDASVTNEQFNLLYNSVLHKKKYAIVTPHRHMRHCKESPGLYCEFTNRFMNMPIEDMELAVGSLLAIRES